MAIMPANTTPIRPQLADLVAFVRAGNQMRYSPVADILYIYRDVLEPGFTVEPGGCMAYRISPDRSRLVAIEIHNFKSIVLKEYPPLANAWGAYSSPVRRLLHTTGRAKRFILNWLAGLVNQSDGEGSHLLAM